MLKRFDWLTFAILKYSSIALTSASPSTWKSFLVEKYDRTKTYSGGICAFQMFATLEADTENRSEWGLTNAQHVPINRPTRNLPSMYPTDLPISAQTFVGAFAKWVRQSFPKCVETPFSEDRMLVSDEFWRVDEKLCDSDVINEVISSLFFLDWRRQREPLINVLAASIHRNRPRGVGWTPLHEVNPPQTMRLTGIFSLSVRRFTPSANFLILLSDGGSSKKRFRCKSPWEMTSSKLEDICSLVLPASVNGAKRIRSMEWALRSNWTGTWSRGKSGASLMMRANVETVNLVCSFPRVFRAQINAFVNEFFPGLMVTLPDEHAPRNSKDLTKLERIEFAWWKQTTSFLHPSVCVLSHQRSS